MPADIHTLPGNATILLVDDNASNLGILSALLNKEGYITPIAKNGPTALKRAALLIPDLILLDIRMPGMDGIATCRQLKANPVTRNIPIIFISAHTDYQEKQECFEAGGVDYISKPFQVPVALARIQTQLDINSLKRKLEEARQELNNARRQIQILDTEREACKPRENSGPWALPEKYPPATEPICNNTQRELHKLSQAVESSPVSIVITDRDGHIEYVNKKFSELTEYTYDEVRGKTPQILRSGHHPETYYEELWTTILAGREWRGEFCNKKKTGEMYWEKASISPMRDTQGQITHFVAVKEDITHRKRADEKIRHAKEAAENASQAKSTFLANMSHEIRTPMNAILGFSEIIKRKTTSPTNKYYAESIHKSGVALLALINDILDLSKIESGKMELYCTPVSLSGLGDELNTMFGDKAREQGLSLNFALDENLPSLLLLDEIRLRQICINLMGNALKFTPRGQVEFAASCQIPENAQGSYVNLEISVTDSGIGIPQNRQQEIFGAFEQVNNPQDRNSSGTGLGLAITQRLTDLMGGTIEVTSKVGEGSRFILRLPRVEIAAADPHAPSNQDAELLQINFAPAKILIVEDIRCNQEILASFLDDWPFRIEIAANGIEALASAVTFQPDLILMDLKMPQMDGYEASRQLKDQKETQDIPIITITAAALKQDQVSVRTVCDGYLTKPIGKYALIQELTKHLPYEAVHGDVSSKIPPQPLSDAEFDGLPTADLKRLHHLALSGDMHQIAQFANDLGKRDEQYDPIAQKLRQMAHAFADEEIVALAEKLLHQ